MRAFAPDLQRLYAAVPALTRVSVLDPFSFASSWTVDLGALQTGAPRPDPLDRLLLARTHVPGTPGSLHAITTDGRLQWREDLGRENGGDMVFTGGPVFSPDGAAAYTGTAILVGQGAFGTWIPAREGEAYKSSDDFFGGQPVWQNFSDWVVKVPDVNYGIFTSEVDSAISAQLPTIAQGGDLDAAIEAINAQATQATQ